jgi:tetrahydromethanopterin S-methyltransferase subunit G
VSDQPVSRAEYEELARRVQALEENFDAHRVVIIAGLQRLERRVDERLDAVDQRFDAVDQRFDAVDQRFDAVDQRLDTVTGTLSENTTLLRAISRHLGLSDS